MFFSVKSAVRIAGKAYIPCVCYSAPEYLKPTIDKMVAEGKAYVYENKVAFQNGKVIEKKVEAEEAQPKVKKMKKEKEKAVPIVDTVEEDIPSPEEIAEDF